MYCTVYRGPWNILFICCLALGYPIQRTHDLEVTRRHPYLHSYISCVRRRSEANPDRGESEGLKFNFSSSVPQTFIAYVCESKLVEIY
jgi:hypothetical protein